MFEILELPVESMKNFMELYSEHGLEVPFNYGGGEVPVELDIDYYVSLEHEGYLTCIVATLDEAVIGYIILVAVPLPHHRGKLLGMTDAFYVLPEHRKSGVFKLLVEYAEKRCAEVGILGPALGVNASFPDAGAVAKALGYNELETYYIKG